MEGQLESGPVMEKVLRGEGERGQSARAGREGRARGQRAGAALSPCPDWTVLLSLLGTHLFPAESLKCVHLSSLYRHVGVCHACRKVCTPSYYSMKSRTPHDPVGTTPGRASSRVRTRSFPSSRRQPHSSCSQWDLSGW